MEPRRPNQVRQLQLQPPVTFAQQKRDAQRKERELAQWAPNASFGQAVKRFFLKYARLDGCASRREYWFAQLFIFLMVALASALYAGGSYLEESGTMDGLLIKDISETLIVSFLAACIIPSISVLGRRLHDANMSAGFLFLLFTPGMVALPIMPMRPSNPLGKERFPGLTREERAQKRLETMMGVAEGAKEFHDRYNELKQDQQASAAVSEPPVSYQLGAPSYKFKVGDGVNVYGRGVDGGYGEVVQNLYDGRYVVELNPPFGDKRSFFESELQAHKTTWRERFFY